MRFYLCAFVACASLLLPLASRGEQVDGPETEGLVERLKGWILTDDTGDITAVSLPERKSQVVFHPPQTADGMGPTIHAISGPDVEGRVAYLLDYFFVNSEKDKRHLLKIVLLDGTGDTELFSRPGSAMWATTAAGNGELGSHVALSPAGGQVAFISHTVNRQMPMALLTLGNIEIWKVADKTGSDTKVLALDHPMSWFPDGRRLAYATLVRRSELPPDAGGLEKFGSYFGETWDELPAVFIYDLESKKSAFFHVGWSPLVSSDGKSMLVGGWKGDDYGLVRVDVATGRSTAVNPPGLAGAVLGTENDLTYYVGLSSKGTKLKLTENNSPLRGPKEMLTIKVSDDAGEKFQTVIPAIDPRSQASFGSTK